MEKLNFTCQNDLQQLLRLSTPVWIFDVGRHKIWWANEQGLAFWKADSLAEIKKRDFSTDSLTAKQRLRQIVDLAKGDCQLTDTWTLYPDGTPQTVILSFQPVVIESKFDGVMIELKQILERDADSEAWRLLEAARATSLMMTTFSMAGRILVQNPAALMCYRSSQLGHEGKSHLESRFVRKEDCSVVFENAASDKIGFWEAEVKTPEGVKTHQISVRRGRDPITGEFVIILSEEDVSDRVAYRKVQKSEKEKLRSKVALSSGKLKISQERYELAVRTASIWDWDILADKLFVSPNFIEALGYKKNDFQRKLNSEKLEGFLHTEDVETYQQKLSQHLENPQEPFELEARFLSKKNQVHWFHLQGKCVRDDSGFATRSAGLMTDVTERKKLESKLMAAQRMEAIGQLTGGIAHDFNNLLTVIQGNAELLQEVGEPDIDLTGEIVSAVNRGADLTKHLLAFARQQTLIPSSVDLRALVPNMKRTLLRGISETVNIEIVQPDCLWKVHADATQLETAILNIALNARDAMPNGGTLTICCSNRNREDIEDVEELELSENQYVELTFRDDGYGMAKETQEKAFEPFFTTKEIGEGSGLGLSMVIGFSRQSKGDARIRSMPHKGTKVSFFLPRSILEDERLEFLDGMEYHSDKSEHIHILENDTHVQLAVSKLVRSLGYQVTTSRDVTEALEFARKNSGVTLYLADIVLPGGMSGLDFKRLVRKIRVSAKVLLMTGYSQDELVQRNLLRNEIGFISKPFDKASLSREIRSTIEPR